MADVIFDGRRFSDFNVIVSGEDTWAQPTRRVTKSPIPGRHGDMIVEAGEFENVNISYPAGIMHDFDDYNNGWEAFSQFLTRRSDAYYRLEDEYHPLYYRMARFVPGIIPKVGTLNRSGQFTVTFDCKPQKWLKSGETEIVINSQISDLEIENATDYWAYPEIKLTPGASLAFAVPGGYQGESAGGIISFDAVEEPSDFANITYTYYTEIGEVVRDYLLYGQYPRKEYATDRLHLDGANLWIPPKTTMYVGAWATGETPPSIDIRIKPRFYTI